ncbi:PaaI family thioesterase [Gordonia alkaliphila]|uniref:PaaI family thioesterase n=1 Tax=Gordonia alkaliphila TaxID=1053547 RepID=UPI001FF4CF53|nr:PaaI family thioesterase [Gordonia alkaliphila]MCK0440758.1 PaaI family thioesterase [Gordonia alkaliphila]
MSNRENERDLAADLAGMVQGLDRVLGTRLIEASGEGVRATLEITADHHQPFGIVHGGVYCAIAESTASISAFCWLQESEIGGTAVGVNNNTDFLRSVSSGTITVTTVPVHRGRRQQLWQIDMVDADGRLLAQSRVRLQNVELPAG